MSIPDKVILRHVLPPGLPRTAFCIAGATVAFLFLVVLYKWVKKINASCRATYQKYDKIPDDKMEQMLDGLEHIGCPKGIRNLWNEVAKDAPFTVLLTGASGYVGQLIVFMLLHCIKNDKSQNKSKHKILLLVRPRKGRMTAQERVDKIKQMHIFDTVRDLWDDAIRIVETSDMNLPNAGIADESMQELSNAKVTHLLHCAADVGFKKTIKELAMVNITSSLHLQKLAHQWPSCKRMVYVSTAFVSPEFGTPESPLREQLVDIGDYDPMELYESMQGDQKLAEKVMTEYGFENNYVFTKCVSEHLLTRRAKTELMVVRPAVVGPAWVQPLPGWNGEKPSTASTMGLLIISRMCRVAPANFGPYPLVPVDVCAIGIVNAMISPIKKKPTGQSSSTCYWNLIWSSSSPIQFWSSDHSLSVLLEYAVTEGLLTRVEAALTVTLSMIVTNFPSTFPFFHQVFNRGMFLLPYYVLLVLEMIGFIKKGSSSDMKQLIPFVDVVKLYENFLFPLYYFESAMHIPPSFDFKFFGDNTANSIRNFMISMQEKNESKKNLKKTQKQKVKAQSDPYPLLPPNWYTLVLIPLIGAFIHTRGLWVPVTLVYLALIVLNPATDCQLLFDVFIRAISGRFGDLPLRFNVAGLGQIIWAVLVRSPIEFVLWWFDEIFFPGHASCPVEEPVFILGQPRSGTTKLLDVMVSESDRFCALTMAEIRFPFLCLHYAIDFFSNLDSNYLGGALTKLIHQYGLNSPMPGGNPEREAMRRINWSLYDEDDAMFMYYGFCHFMLGGFFPDPDLVHRLYQFDMLPERSRTRLLQFHRKAVQKVLYRRGAGRTYMAKWVAGWNGQLEQAKIEYPDAKFIVIVRDPKESLPSWMKLQSLLSLGSSGNNLMTDPKVKQAVIDVNKKWFQKEIEFCEETPNKSLHVLRYKDFIKDIPKEISRIHGFLGKEITNGSRYDKALKAENNKQSNHKTTGVSSHEQYLSNEQIEKEFPDLLGELKFS